MIAFVMIVFLMAAAAFTQPVFAVEDGLSVHGRLRVEGVGLVDCRGEAVQLRGMSSHGLRWFPEYTNYAAILSTKRRGANMFRLAMYADSNHGGYSESPEAATINRQFLLAGLENILAADMYAIVDWHLLEDENPLHLMDNAIEFFREVSARYPNHPGILYEICNEPNGDTTWGHIREYAEEAIKAIRESSPDAVILVGTPMWSSNVLAALEKPLECPNVMYSFHLYTGFSTHEFHRTLDAARRNGLPVFVTEWGFSRDEKTGEMNIAKGIEFIEYMRKHGISWANWSLCNKDEDFSAIRPEVTKISGWTDEDLTEVGRLVFTALSGK